MNQATNQPRAADLAYLRFAAPDLDLMTTFLSDFGFVVSPGETEAGTPCLYSRGTDGDPYVHVVEQGEPRFIGVGFLMSAAEDIDLLAGMAGASPIESVQLPGGGRRVRFTDSNGFEVDGIHGWETSEPEPPCQRVPVNCGENRQRTEQPVRLQPGPAHVKRIGHCVLFVKDFRRGEAWFKERFGLLTSDEIYLDEDNKAQALGAFMRCDMGDMPVDHHTLFLIGNPDRAPGLQHAAFEVHDWDDLMLGHDHLHGGEYRHHWGIGKHLLGSQVFDYWKDPYGHVLEHFTDGDLFSAAVPPHSEPVENLRAVQWGAQAPAA
ncbi:MAG: VOC family protein [Pseudomonadota bacterium]